MALGAAPTPSQSEFFGHLLIGGQVVPAISLRNVMKSHNKTSIEYRELKGKDSYSTINCPIGRSEHAEGPQFNSALEHTSDVCCSSGLVV